MERVQLRDGAWYHDSDKKTELPPYRANRGLESQEDLMSAMKDSRYKTDESFRQYVASMIADAEKRGVDLGWRTTPETASNFVMDSQAEQVECDKEMVLALFRDPRYATSALFRRGVMEAIKAMPESDMFMQDPGSFQRVAVESGKITGPMEPAPKVEAGDEGESE